jgi:hypothetical protein
MLNTRRRAEVVQAAEVVFPERDNCDGRSKIEDGRWKMDDG